MPKAEIEHTPTRRKFLGHLAGGAAVAAVAAGVSTVAQAAPVVAPNDDNPDADLIALCARFDAAQREIDVLHVEYDGIMLAPREWHAWSGPQTSGEPRASAFWRCGRRPLLASRLWPSRSPSTPGYNQGALGG
jgi:hypothetical protein